MEIYSSHNQAEYIAKIVCAYCLKYKNPFKPQPFREMFPTKQKIENTYKLLSMLGVKGRFTEPKTSVLLRAHLFSETIFPMLASNIELMCRFNNGSVRYWDGSGAKIELNIEKRIEHWDMLVQYGGLPDNLFKYVEYQVDIAGIWTEISPYLES